MNIAIYNYQELNDYIGDIERVSISLTKSLLMRGVNVIIGAGHHSQYDIAYKTSEPMSFLSEHTTTSPDNMLSFENPKIDCEKENRILFCAMVSPQKRPERALYVWKQIYKQLPDWSLDIVGDGFQLDSLKRLSDKLRLERVTFHGFKNPVNFYKRSKIFLMTSDYEGWGLTLTEAMQYKCVPVAMATYSSVFDIVDDAENGFLIKNVDCHVMADRVLWLAQNTQKMNEMAEQAYKKVQCFSADRIADKWVDVFEDVVNMTNR